MSLSLPTRDLERESGPQIDPARRVYLPQRGSSLYHNQGVRDLFAKQILRFGSYKRLVLAAQPRIGVSCWARQIDTQRLATSPPPALNQASPLSLGDDRSIPRPQKQRQAFTKDLERQYFPVPLVELVSGAGPAVSGSAIQPFP